MSEEQDVEGELSQRKFLHDLSNPLATVTISIDFVLGELEKAEGVPELALKQLKKADQALEKVHDMIHSRRALLKGEESAK